MSLISLYLDDSDGSTVTSRFSLWGGFMIEEQAAITLQDKLTHLKQSHGLDNCDPIKWTPERKKTEYDAQRRIKNQTQFKFDVLEVIANSDVSLMSAVFEAGSEEEKREMHKQLMNDLSVRLQFAIQDRIKETKNKYRGAFVLANTGTSNLEMSKEMLRLHREGASFKSQNWVAERSRRTIILDKLEPAIYFSYEAHNPLLQLADFVASCLAWTIKNQEFHYFKRIKSKFRSKNDKVKGAGILCYPHESRIIEPLLQQYDLLG